MDLNKRFSYIENIKVAHDRVAAQARENAASTPERAAEIAAKTAEACSLESMCTVIQF